MINAMISWSTEHGSRQLISAALGFEKREDEIKGEYISSLGITEPRDFLVSDEGRAAQKRAWVSAFADHNHYLPY